MRNSVPRDIFVRGLEVNPWIEVLNEMNQNGFCSQIPARSAQTELWNSFESWINGQKTASCSEHVSERHKTLMAARESHCPEFSPAMNSFTSLRFNPPGEIPPIAKCVEIPAVIWLEAGFCLKSFHKLNKTTTKKCIYIS